MNADTSGLTVAGHIGTWHTIDQHEVGGHSFYLMEHDTYGCLLYTSYTVCQRYGIETSDYSFGYIAGWSSGKETKELKSSLDTIRKTAAEMIEALTPSSRCCWQRKHSPQRRKSKLP